jgi:hypothetical protein
MRDQGIASRAAPNTPVVRSPSAFAGKCSSSERAREKRRRHCGAGQFLGREQTHSSIRLMPGAEAKSGTALMSRHLLRHLLWIVGMTAFLYVVINIAGRWLSRRRRSVKDEVGGRGAGLFIPRGHIPAVVTRWPDI